MVRPLLVTQFIKLLESICNNKASIGEEIHFLSLVSSVKSSRVEYRILVCKTLIKIKNNKGPECDPWATPDEA